MKILVINPNSDENFSKDMEVCGRDFMGKRHVVDARCVPSAPKFIVTDYEKSLAIPGLVKLFQEEEPHYDAFITAAFCDPAIHILRELTSKPVLGIGECSIKLATMLGSSFSILTFYDRSIPSLHEQVAALGMEKYLASIRVLEEDDPSLPYEERFYPSAQKAVYQDKAEVLILGCGGLTNGVDKKLSQRLHVPVLDGLICALIVASGLAEYGVGTSKICRYKKEY